VGCTGGCTDLFTRAAIAAFCPVSSMRAEVNGWSPVPVILAVVATSSPWDGKRVTAPHCTGQGPDHPR
jgi:hypothetical protein